MLSALVVSIPFVSRLADIGPAVASGSALIYLVPPAWFVGVERVLLGSTDRADVMLALVGATVLAVAAAVAFGAYLSLYRHFDTVALRSSGSGRLSDPPVLLISFRIGISKGGPFRAVYDFVRLTLQRASLPQGVVTSLSACGAAVVFNGLAGDVRTSMQGAAIPAHLVDTVIWSPFALMFAVAFALKASFSLPVDRQANWVFRMTEGSETRHEQLRVVERVMWWTAVAAPVMLLVPLEWLLLGPRALACIAVGIPYGLLFVELLLTGWQRIPFTCSYLPGKRFVGQTIVLGLAAFWFFGNVGAFLVGQGLGRPWRALLVIATLTVIVGVLRRHRLKRWRETPLLFEDQFPDVLQRLGLTLH
jgi:hypothetical protein